MRMDLRAGWLAGAAMLLGGPAATAADPIRLTIQGHRFEPAEVTAPAGERFRIEVENRDPTPAEFESPDLRIEKIVAAGSKITVSAGPLKPGRYDFVDDYHPDTIGTLSVTPKPEQ
jgi:hypothetical protein